ncbi:hypothetical protein Sjap_009776 [Stephania japonica]|uniref:Uncharacterized protein n=1 Tax=Stephania japonica TaxID=461633 RepID=A0AAP0J8D5_9MAGN
MATSHHVRSISLPSTSDPLTLKVEEQLNRSKSSEVASTSSPICHNLNGLRDLYDSVDELLHLPHTLQALPCLTSKECVNELLEESLRTIDICSTTRDVLLQLKEMVQDLQSAVRRKRGVELNEVIREYMVSKKKVIKRVHQCLVGEIKNMENKHSYLDDTSMVAIVGEQTINVFKGLLCTVSQPGRQRKPSRWSLVSKLMSTRRVASCDVEGAAEISEFEKVDEALSTLITRKSPKETEAVVDAQNLQKQLKAMNLSIQNIEEGLDRVCRSTIKTRVSLLNFLNH